MQNNIKVLIENIKTYLNDLENLGVDLKAKGAVKNMIHNNFSSFKDALKVINQNELLNLLERETGIRITRTYFSRTFHKLTNSHDNYFEKVLPNIEIKEKKPSREIIQKSDNNKGEKPDSFKHFKNLNRISLNLIDKYDLDLDILKSLNVITIQDSAVVEDKIRHYCKEIDRKKMREKYSHILNKEQ